MNYSRLIVSGNLCRDVDLKYTSNEMAIASTAVAVNRKDSKGEKHTMFIEVTLFGKRAEAFERFHKKGSNVFLEGELRQDHWEDKETGQKRSKHVMTVNNWEFMDAPKEDTEKNPFE